MVFMSLGLGMSKNINIITFISFQNYKKVYHIYYAMKLLNKSLEYFYASWYSNNYK